MRDTTLFNRNRDGGTTTALLDDYKRLTISQLKRAGFLEPVPVGKAWAGVVTVSNYWGHTAQIQVGAMVSDKEKVIAVAYTYGGEQRAYKIRLDFTPSNLPNHANTGYYYFICPATGNRCRKLYLVGGYFVSRHAFKALNFWQTLSKSTRTFSNPAAQILARDIMAHEMGSPRYRKETYRGKPTPYGRKLAKWKAKL